MASEVMDPKVSYQVSTAKPTGSPTGDSRGEGNHGAAGGSWKVTRWIVFFFFRTSTSIQWATHGLMGKRQVIEMVVSMATGVSLYRWMVFENHRSKWMMTRGTPMT